MTLEMTLISAGKFCATYFAERERVYLHVRYENPLESEADIDLFASELGILVDKAVPDASLIADVRRVKGNNHPAFERRIVPILQGFSRTFAFYVTVTATVTGALQMRRLGRESGFPFATTTLMRDAISQAMLRGSDGEHTGGFIRPRF